MKKTIQNPIIRILLSDLALITFYQYIFVRFIKGYRYSHPGIEERYILLLIITNLIWIFTTVLITRYKMEVNKSYFVELKKVAYNIVLFVGLISIFAFVLKDFQYSRIIIFGSTFCAFISQCIIHYIFYKLIKIWRLKKNTSKRIIIVGTGPCALDLHKEMQKLDSNLFDIIGFIENDGCHSVIDQKLILGNINEIEHILNEHDVDELFISTQSFDNKKIETLVDLCNYFGIRIRIVFEKYKLFKRNFSLDVNLNIPIINANEIPLDGYYNYCQKRIFDIIFSSIVLIICFPIFIIIGIVIKIDSKGPIFYIVERIGYGCKPFKLYKFRTMRYCATNSDKLSTDKNDKRITSVGRVLRKYSIDEFPQFFNVLKGNMSIVGPRPHRAYLNKVFQDCVEDYMTRHYIKPGITGWAQVNGWRGPTTTNKQKMARTDHDLWYLNNWSLLLDAKIILLTVFGKKVRKNAF